MRESLKALKRLEHDYLWQRMRKLPKPWLDIGCGDCPIPGAQGVDIEFGPLRIDAQRLPGIAERSQQLIWSSHCLEHLPDWMVALSTWVAVLAPGGCLWVTVPDFYLYEHGQWPSPNNPQHLHHFTMEKLANWYLRWVDPAHAQLLRLQRVDAGYDYKASTTIDQTMTAAEASIEMVLQRL